MMKKPLLFGIDYKEMKRLAFGENKNKDELKNVKKQDLGTLDHNGKTKISKTDTEEQRDVMKLKKKKPMLFGIDYNVLKMLAFGKKKIKAEKKNVQKQDLARFDHNVQTKIKGG